MCGPTDQGEDEDGNMSRPETGTEALTTTIQLTSRVLPIISCDLTHKANIQKGTQNSTNQMQPVPFFQHTSFPTPSGRLLLRANSDKCLLKYYKITTSRDKG